MKKKLNATLLTETAQELKHQCEQLDQELRTVKKQCNKLSRMLQYAVWEEDMVEAEPIVFEGTTADFVKLIASLLLDGRWTVNGQHEIKPFLRALDAVCRIRYDPTKECATFGTLMNAVQDYLDRLREN
ncbi:MAG: hypothetical protein LUD46_22345 [Parabacteroides sp.]|nr:hypothetical protein [Parabacteroides sp.]